MRYGHLVLAAVRALHLVDKMTKSNGGTSKVLDEKGENMMQDLLMRKVVLRRNCLRSSMVEFTSHSQVHGRVRQGVS